MTTARSPSSARFVARAPRAATRGSRCAESVAPSGPGHSRDLGKKISESRACRAEQHDCLARRSEKHAQRVAGRYRARTVGIAHARQAVAEPYACTQQEERVRRRDALGVRGVAAGARGLFAVADRSRHPCLRPAAAGGWIHQRASRRTGRGACCRNDELARNEAELVDLRAHVDAGFLAAKRDVQELDIRMQAGFAAMKESMRETELRMDARFDAKLADLERRMTMRLGTVTVAAVGAMSAIVKLLA